jgi:hypothetical protein
MMLVAIFKFYDFHFLPLTQLKIRNESHGDYVVN